MTYCQSSGDSTVDWYRSYHTSDAMKYQAYYQSMMQGPYTAKALDTYHARYDTWHKQYRWYNLAGGAQNPWMYHYMYPHYGTSRMARYSQQSWAIPPRQDILLNQNYQHQHQLPYLLFHQPSAQSSPASLLIPQSQQKSTSVPSSLRPDNEQWRETTQRTESPLFGTGQHIQDPNPEPDSAETAYHINVLNDAEDSKTVTYYQTGEKTWQSHPLKEVQKSSLRLDTLNKVNQENFGHSACLSNPSITAAARVVMGQTMLERELERAGKGHLVESLMKDSRISTNLLGGEKVGKLCHQNVNEPVSLSLSATVPADKDLEELIFIDQHLDDILKSLDRKNTLSVDSQMDLLDIDAKRSKNQWATTNDVCDAGVRCQRKKKRQRRRVEHICAVCGERFTCRASKNVHMRIHSGERPFECPHCNRRFAHRTSMTSHIRTHTGDKPYTCTDCGRAFANYSSWQKHCRLHTGEKPYVCAVCKKAFNQSSNLKRHRKLHFGSAVKKLI